MQSNLIRPRRQNATTHRSSICGVAQDGKSCGPIFVPHNTVIICASPHSRCAKIGQPIGLIDAIEKFDPSRAIKFETYGVPRVRGAILDELRSIDWVPRSVRAKARAVDAALSKLEGQLGRSPTDRELADELEMTTGDLDDILRQTSRAGLLQLDDVLFRQGGSGGQTLGDTLQDQGDAPGATIELEETRRQLAKAIQRLDDRERKVLTLYYYEGLNLAEIGEILGVTESRACQIHTKAVLHLRQRLRDELT